MREVRFENGRTVDADKESMEEHAPECPECDATVHPINRLGRAQHWVCENEHTFTGDDRAD